ncbi:MAG: AmmeMemoRadiSam system protein A [Candidatus Nanopelagicales bacterium]
MLSDTDRELALDLAVRAIDEGLRTGRRWHPEHGVLTPALREVRASFVTLHRDGALRGCIGSLVATDPLGFDVARRAQDAAFSDPRFAPVAAAEVDHLHVEVSVLSVPEPVLVTGWAELREIVRPGVDGLVVQAGYQRGTFLPAVWKQLPDPEGFLDALWRKAGMVPRSWPRGLEISRYSTEEFGRQARANARR